MSRRFVLTFTAAAALVAGAGAASAATTHSDSHGVVADSKQHQLCLLLYRNDPEPQHICVNW